MGVKEDAYLIPSQQLLVEPNDDPDSYIDINVFQHVKWSFTYYGNSIVYLKDLMNLGSGNETYKYAYIKCFHDTEGERNKKNDYLVLVFKYTAMPAASNRILNLSCLKKRDIDDFLKKARGLNRKRNKNINTGAFSLPDIITNLTSDSKVRFPERLRQCRQLYRALLIGMSYSNTSYKLDGPIYDVCQMKNLLVETFKWRNDENHLRILCDNDEKFQTPTKSVIIESLKWLVEDIHAGDVIFLYYAGHGTGAQDPQIIEEDGLNEAILPSDHRSSGIIIDDVIHDIVLKRLPSGARLTAIIDCCNSGSMLDLPFVWKDSKWTTVANPYFVMGDIQLLSSCLETQFAFEASTNQYDLAGGVFTKLLIKTLKNEPSITFTALIDKAQAAIKNNQTPQLSSSQRFNSSRPFDIQKVIHNTNYFTGQVRWDENTYNEVPSNKKPLFGPITEPYNDLFQFYYETFSSSSDSYM